jgi:hypothetical protein
VFVNAGARLLCTSDGVCVIVYVQFSSVGYKEWQFVNGESFRTARKRLAKGYSYCPEKGMRPRKLRRVGGKPV